MKNRNGRAKFNNFWIFLYSGQSSTNILENMMLKPRRKKDVTTQWKKNKPENLQPIKKLKSIYAYHNSVQTKSWHGNLMWMTPLKAGM